MSEKEIVARTDELTDTVQLVVDAFRPHRADHRPNGSDWYRWLIYNDQTSEVTGIVSLTEVDELALSVSAQKVRLRQKTVALLRHAA
jgi:hypothetical protein